MQRSLRSAIPELGTDNYKYISIAADVNLSDADLVSYADTQGFDWEFSVASSEFLNAFVSQYGRSVITTPNMVHFVLRPDGSMSEFFQGAPAPQQLVQEIRGAGSQQ